MGWCRLSGPPEPVELAQLVHGLVAHQRLTNKQNQVGGVDADELRPAVRGWGGGGE